MKIVKILSLCVIILVAIEILLQLASWVGKRVWFTPNTFAVEDRVIRVVTLGESTTAGDYNWPLKLERRMVELGYKLKVYNLAMPGTTIFFQRQRLFDYFPKIRPQIIISMLGTNEINRYFFRRYDPRQDSFVNSVKIVRLFRGAYSVVRQILYHGNMKEISYSLVGTTEYNNKTHKIVSELVELIQQNSNSYIKSDAEIKRIISGIPSDELLPILEKLLKDTGKDIFDPNISHEELSLRHSYFKRYIDISVKNVFMTANFMWSSRKQGDLDECYLVADRAMKEEIDVDNHFRNRLMECAVRDRKSKRKRWVPLLKAFNLKFDTKGIRPDDLYREIVSYSKRQGACSIVMQYPLERIEELTSKFTADHPDLFIDNRAFFLQKLKKHERSTIFSDLFAGEWGHMTDFGRELIVENLVPQLVQFIGTKPKCLEGSLEN